MKRIRYALRTLVWLGLVLALSIETGTAQDLNLDLNLNLNLNLDLGLDHLDYHDYLDYDDYDDDRELTAEVSADGIDEILLNGHDGKATIEVGTSDQIRIRVRIKAKRKGLVYKSSAGRAYVEDARLETDTRGGTLKVTLSDGRGHKDTEEAWTIIVPRRLAVVVEMSAASIDITDVTGGVEVNLGVGKANVDVPRGNIEVRVSVGNATVETQTDSYGDVDLRAQVGKTRLWIGGHRIKYSNPPGPGSKVSMEGEGRDQIKVFVQVGDASLRVG